MAAIIGCHGGHLTVPCCDTGVQSEMSKRGLSRLLGLFCIAVAIAGCTRDDPRPNTNVTALSQHIHLSMPPAAARFEIATLPERNDEGVPGPTDYVALIAAIRPQGPDNAIIANQPRIGEAAAVPEAFLRAWLSEGEKDALQRAAAPDGTAYNIRALTRQAAKRAIAVPLNAGEWVLYIEYVAP